MAKDFNALWKEWAYTRPEAIENDDPEWLAAVIELRDRKVEKHYGPGDHPSGSSQDAHAGSRLIPIDPTKSGPKFPDLDNTLTGMPKELAGKVKTQMEKYLGTKRTIMARYRRLLRAAAKRSTSGVNWYKDTHTWLEGLASKYDYTTEQAAGATAAMSSGLIWEAKPGRASNRLGVEAMMRHLKEDKPLSSYGLNIEAMQEYLDKDALKFGTTAPRLKPSTRLSDIKDSRHATMVWAGVWRTEGYGIPAQYGFDPYSGALEILRGRPVTEVLTGPKRRSFYNNMMLIENDDVTIDVQMMGAALGRRINSNVKADRNMQSSIVGTPKLDDVGVGVHPILADYVRQLTNEVNTSSDDPWDNVRPMQVQAIIWSEFKRTDYD